ncbi:MAG TPA: glycosyltransferase, partial [Rhizomicrobium sp.]|nr:glycosyltransferase [Rhizomicrobium sp.]
MTQLKRVAFIGNSLPRRCGIATFTTDLHRAVQSSGTQIEASIVAMNDDRRAYDYPPEVGFQIRDDVLEDYTRAADFLNAQKYEVVSLQHEFGIFGGDAGAHVLTLIDRLDMPVVTTFHTVLSRPTPAQYNVLRKIAELSSLVVVMAEKGRELLHT